VEPHRVELSSVHPQGTCARGADPERSACDPEGRLRGAPRIWVACASGFPSSIGAPPQLTVMAFATLVAERVAADLGR
jgi:choline dehydrogenase-like flavoprotein